jgi:hypothetical protein
LTIRSIPKTIGSESKLGDQMKFLSLSVSIFVLSTALFFSGVANSDEKNGVIRSDMEAFYWHYYMDTNTCICWIGPGQAISSGGLAGAAVVDCKRLAKRKEFAKAVEGCG